MENEIQKALTELKRNADNLQEIEEPGDLITAQETADMLKITVGTLYNQMYKQQISFIRLPNGRVRFSRRAVRQFIDTGYTSS